MIGHRTLRVSDRTITVLDIVVTSIGLMMAIGGPLASWSGKISPSLALNLCTIGAGLLVASAFAFWQSRKLRVIDKAATLKILKELAARANGTVYLFRAHHLFGGELDEFYEALGKSLAARPDLIVHRAILLRHFNEATRKHLWKLHSIFDGRPNCEIRFVYDAAIGFNMALIDDTVVVGIPDDGGTEFSGAVVVRDPEPVRLLRSAFQQFWCTRCEPWFDGAQEVSEQELRTRLDRAVEKARAVSRLIARPYPKIAGKQVG